MAERKEVRLSEKRFRSYLGAYAVQPGAALVATFEGGRLMAQRAGQTKVEIYPEAEDRFFMKPELLNFVNVPQTPSNSLRLACKLESGTPEAGDVLGQEK